MEVRKISNTKNIICLVIGGGMLFICVISILVGIFFEKRKWLSQSSDLFFLLLGVIGILLILIGIVNIVSNIETNKYLKNTPYSLDYQKEISTYTIIGKDKKKPKNGALKFYKYSEWKDYIEKTFKDIIDDEDAYRYMIRRLRNKESYKELIISAVIPIEVGMFSTFYSAGNNVSEFGTSISILISAIILSIIVTVNYLECKGTYVNIDGIREFLSTLSYPLYFLDFETMQPVIPLFLGTKPYQQIPFQYSLHYIESAGAPLLHKEFLAESGENPLRAIAEALCRDIPMNVCVTAYNKSFECSRIKELAVMFTDLAEHLLNIRDNIKDLLDPFQAGHYYNRAMGGSFSIKSVLPAIFPNDPKLNYHNLEGVHNGSEAMTIFPRIKDMPAEEQKKARHNLLKYCELDTYAMVKVWGELVRIVEGDTEDGD